VANLVVRDTVPRAQVEKWLAILEAEVGETQK
jgi:hypothetical protein